MSKLSGACGRLMCCLKYEELAYKENSAKLPKVGEIVKVGNEQGKVIGVDIIQLKVKLRIGNTKEDERYETFHVDKLTWNKGNTNNDSVEE
ncbi:hypothetical protein D3C71_1742800 [compost metagenome]